MRFIVLVLAASCAPSAVPPAHDAAPDPPKAAEPLPPSVMEAPPAPPAVLAPEPASPAVAGEALPVAVPPIPFGPKPIAPKPIAAVAAAKDDPLHGVFSLADATRGLTGAGPLVAEIDTSVGALTCRLLEAQAPRNVANFVGLARGLRPFRDPTTNAWIKRPAYDGTTFHRIVRGFMIQGGDPTGTGQGDAGYLVPDEIWANGAHDRAGLLCTANRGPNTNGMQFFITDDVAAHLDGGFTIFGACAPIAIVHQIAATPVNGERPRVPVEIRSVRVHRAP